MTATFRPGFQIGLVIVLFLGSLSVLFYQHLATVLLPPHDAQFKNLLRANNGTMTACRPVPIRCLPPGRGLG